MHTSLVRQKHNDQQTACADRVNTIPRASIRTPADAAASFEDEAQRKKIHAAILKEGLG